MSKAYAQKASRRFTCYGYKLLVTQAQVLGGFSFRHKRELDMKIRLLHIICTTIVLTGCTLHTLDTGLTSLHGRHIDHAFLYLGYPDHEDSIAGKTVYIWSSAYEGSRTVPNTSYIRGTVGSTSYRGTTTTYTTEAVNYTCEIRLITENSHIVDYDYYGDIIGCADYATYLCPLTVEE